MNECIEAFGEVINSAACSPGNKNLYYVNEESTELCEHKKQIFHHIVAKMLHICKRVRLDLQVTIGFLCTRVRAPTQQDWLKLKRLLQYVYGTLDMQRVVSLENFSTMNIYVDAAHAVLERVRLGVAYRWEQVLSIVDHQNRVSIQNLPPRASWLVRATIYHTQYGCCISFKSKATKSTRRTLSRTIKALLKFL